MQPLCWSPQFLPGWNPSRYDSRWRWHQGPIDDESAPHVEGAIISAWDGRWDGAAMDRFPVLRVISTYGVGTDHIDLHAAHERHIVVCNTPDDVTDATAEMALLLTLAAVRELVRWDRVTREGGFPPYRVDDALSGQLHGLAVGILGYGRVGQRIAELLRPFRTTLRYHRRSEPWLGHPGACRSLPELAAASRVLIVALPLTEHTHHLVDDHILSLMPRGSYLVNVGRGPVVNEDALVRHLHSGHLAGAGLDVYEHEPAIHPGLRAMPQVVLSPHRGTSTWETRLRMTQTAVGNLVYGLTGAPANRVI
ncbi:MAG: NAD(P)-dependent oxidoreductase [Thermaerobacter sp.]|nr:NAD(P)-dependent oxidoreductase [Thermaerobacter sp.]